MLAISAGAGEGWGLTEEYLRAGFAEPAWTGTRVEPIEVTATIGRLPGLLPSAFRAH